MSIFRLPGVRVWELESNRTTVVLHHLTVLSAGTYRYLIYIDTQQRYPLKNT